MWNDLDVAKALAYRRWQRAHCQRCGQHRADWYDEHGNQLKDPPYEVAVLQCPSCEMLDDARDEDPRAKAHGAFLAFRQLPDLRDEAASADE